ncbi:hypothetical protein KC19_1G019800, partial [Ceratodon purpureus]
MNPNEFNEKYRDEILEFEAGEVFDRPKDQIRDLIEGSNPPCPNGPKSAGMANLDDVLCVRKLCPNCTAAGRVWTSGFGTKGFWRKVRRESEVAVGPTLNPEIWEQLQPDLLGHVVARLPTPGIGRMRALSKAWNKEMSTSSAVAKQCAETQPSLHALMGFSVVTGECWVRAYDTRARKWHAYSIQSIPNVYAPSLSSCDAGLACFVPKTLRHEALDLEPVMVCNPLTREWKQLPMQRLVLKQACMVQLRVDRGSGSYTVTLVGWGASSVQGSVYEGVVAEVYNSKTQQWSAVGSNFKVVDYFWPWPLREHDFGGVEPMTLGLYESWEEGIAEYYNQHFTARPLSDSEVPGLEGWAGGWEVRSIAIHGNDLYILESFPHSEEDRVCTKFNVAKYEEGRWGFDSESTRLPIFTGPPEIFEFEMDCSETLVETLFVCNTFFLVASAYLGATDIFQAKLFDVESGEWSQQFPIWCDDQWYSILQEDVETAFVCELRWDACP